MKVSWLNQCCGTCDNCRKSVTGEFVCDCCDSEMYGLDTAYDDRCDEWVERED